MSENQPGEFQETASEKGVDYSSRDNREAAPSLHSGLTGIPLQTLAGELYAAEKVQQITPPFRQAPDRISS
jgi:hypothetical protein